MFKNGNIPILFYNPSQKGTNTQLPHHRQYYQIPHKHQVQWYFSVNLLIKLSYINHRQFNTKNSLFPNNFSLQSKYSNLRGFRKPRYWLSENIIFITFSKKSLREQIRTPSRWKYTVIVMKPYRYHDETLLLSRAGYGIQASKVP